MTVFAGNHCGHNEEYGDPRKAHSQVRMSYEGSGCCVKAGGVEVASGLRQGCPLAPSLFNIALEWVMTQTSQNGGMSLGEFRCDRLAYADAVDLMAETLEKVEDNARTFASAAARMEL